MIAFVTLCCEQSVCATERMHTSRLAAEVSHSERLTYTHGGKELDRTSGLDLYDFEARALDPASARFTSMDPLCEKYYGISPYAYCANNPLWNIDPSGMFTFENIKPKGESGSMGISKSSGIQWQPKPR